jgi:probable HAF family extracellular repeat protein
MNRAEQPLPLDELSPLVAALCDGAIDDEGLARLERLLAADPAARRWYIAYMDLHGDLCWDHLPCEGPGHTSSFRIHHSGPALLDPPVVVDVSPVLHSPRFTLHSPVGGFLFSYTMSAVLLGIGLLIGWAWRTSHEQQVVPVAAGGGPAVVQSGPAVSEQPLVGRITGLRDCQWSVVRGQSSVVGESEIPNQKSEIVDHQFLVPLGAKYRLASGFMEITYDTGARVLLQGPATYEVESANGGLLSIGRLTARVEQKGAGGGEKGEWSVVSGQWSVGGKSQIPLDSRLASLPSPASLLPSSGAKGERTANPTLSRSGIEPTASLALRPSTLFFVRTPTAVVTDLGTEFGVEVDKSGASRAHVFQGSVELRRAGDAPPKVVRLVANESARVGRDAKRAIAVTRGPGEPDGFVRQIPGRAPIKRPPLGTGIASAPSYRLIDLGTLGGAESRAISINAAGAVAGFSTTNGGDSHAFLYAGGVMTDLHAFQGPMSMAFGVNNRGQVVGDYLPDENGPCHAFLYSGGKMTDLGTLYGGDSFARGINDRGQVVGHCTDRKSGRNRAFLYSGGKMTDLGTLGTDSYAHDVNADGQVVGYCATAGKKADRAFLCRLGVGMKDLGTLGGSTSSALRINDLGQIVGRSATAEAGDGARRGLRAFLLAGDSGMKDLGSLGGYASSAFGINGKGQVVGDAVDSHGTIHAFLHQPDGTMIDLNGVVDAALGWTLNSARAINNPGQIAGYGTAPDGNTRAFLLAPLAKTREPGAAEPATIRGDRRDLPMNQ